MTLAVDYYFFMQSPWAYLGAPRFEALQAKYKFELHPIPMAAGEVFPVSGGLPLAKRAPQRQAYRNVELSRWRDYLNMPLILMPTHFPLAGDLAERLILAQRESGLGQAVAAMKLAHRFMRALWADDRNLADPATLRALIKEEGLDDDALFRAAEGPKMQEAYKADTERAIKAQVFGAPSYVLNGEIFWGQDRLDFLDRALARAAG